MITITECRKHLKDTKLSDARIEEIRNYIYAIGIEIIRKNIRIYEQEVRGKNK